LHVQLIFLFKINVVSPIGSTLDQEKTDDIYGTPVVSPIGSTLDQEKTVDIYGTPV
jgi:hypothetical protein